MGRARVRACLLSMGKGTSSDMDNAFGGADAFDLAAVVDVEGGCSSGAGRGTSRAGRGGARSGRA